MAYEDFTQLYETYSAFKEGLESGTTEARIDGKAKVALMNRATNPLIKRNILNMRDVEQFLHTLQPETQLVQGNLEGMVNTPANISDMINQMPEVDAKVAVQLCPGRNAYAGANAELYNNIARARAAYSVHKEILTKKGPEQKSLMRRMVEGSVAGTLNENDQRIYQNMGGFSDETVLDTFSRSAQAAERQYHELVAGNEKGFVAASVDTPEAFLGLYDAVRREKRIAERRAENKSHLMDPIEDDAE